MKLLIEDSALRRRLGDAGRREIQLRFSAERMVENTIAVYEEVLRDVRKE
jgi:glycosyltransferase involved in cell wall biosynthesis